MGFKPSLVFVILPGQLISAFAQTYTVSTFAGGVSDVPVNIPATSASLSLPYGSAVDTKGNVFLTNGNVVLRVDAVTGTIAPIAGDGTAGFSGDDGLATSAHLNQPQGLAIDAAGNLYISDTGNTRVRKVSNGVITTVAGTAKAGFGGDNGRAASAQLNQPLGLAVDAAANLYIADWGNQRIRKVSKGIISTVAGAGFPGFSGDGGPATDARLFNPTGVAVDSAGNLYIADAYNNRVREVSNGVIATVAGNGIVPPGATPGPPGPGLPPAGGFSGDGGPATNAALYEPIGVAVDSAGNLYIADSYNGRIREVSNGIITTAGGNGGVLGGEFPPGGNSTGDGGPAASAHFTPLGVSVDSAGDLYIADGGGPDFGTERIRKISNGTITTVAGSAKPTAFYSGDNGPATAAKVRSASGVAVDGAGNVYIADTGNERIRKVSNGIITTLAGNGTGGFSGDGGPAASAALSEPLGLAADAAGNVYIADSRNNRIRKIAGGVITTIAGNGTAGFGGDGGPAASAQLSNPRGVAVDAAGNLFIADTLNNRIREVSSGVITTVAGSGVLAPGNGIPGGRGYGGFSGDGGPATSAQLSSPNSVAIDSAGSLYFGDYDNYRIRKVSGGTITTVAGSGPNGGFGGFAGDGGRATSAQLNNTSGIALDAAGNLYIADAGNLRVRKVVAGVIDTIAGKGTGAFSGDNGPAIDAAFDYPSGIAVDAAGNVYTSDYLNNRVRVLTPGAAPAIAVIGPIYSSIPIVQPGSWISIRGTELAKGTAVWNDDFPVSLAGTSVAIDNKPAFLWYVSPTQINLQVPDDAASGTVSVAVTTSSGTGTSTVKLAPQAPSLSLLGDGRHVVAEIATPDGSGLYGGGTYDLLGPVNTFSFGTRAVKAGETLMLYGVGFGPTVASVPAGKPFSGSAPAFNPVTVTIGGVQAKVIYAGIIQAGLFQINVIIPGVAGGDQPIIATVNGAQTPAGPAVSVQ